MPEVFVFWHFFCTFANDMQKMITILGPTASGKTPVAVCLAAEIGGEIISAPDFGDASPCSRVRLLV